MHQSKQDVVHWPYDLLIVGIALADDLTSVTLMCDGDMLEEKHAQQALRSRPWGFEAGEQHQHL